MASYATVKSVILKAKEALDNDIFYDPVRQSGSYSKNRKIQEGSEEEHLLTVLKEKASYKTTTDLFNLLVNQPKEGNDFVSVKCVFNTIQRTHHTKRRPTKVGQASDDRLFWKRARLIYCLQYLVRLGKETIVTEEVLDSHQIDDKIKYNYQYLQEHDLAIDDLYRIAFWDEIHFHQEVGEGRDVFISFPRDKFGTYDKSKEEDEEKADRVSNMKNKYHFQFNVSPYLLFSYLLPY